MLESKSTCKYSVQLERDAFNYLKSKHRFIGYRVKTPYAEVDLVFFSEDSYHIFEVKSQGYGVVFSSRVTGKQAARLCRAQLYLQNQFKIPIRTHLIVVGGGLAAPACYYDFLADIL